MSDEQRTGIEADQIAPVPTPTDGSEVTEDGGIQAPAPEIEIESGEVNG